MNALSREFPHSVATDTDNDTGGDVFRPDFRSVQKSPAIMDPFEVATRTPALWAQFLSEAYGSVRAIVIAFDVTEKTARKWLSGEGGANMRHTVIAQAQHPQLYHERVVQPVMIAAE